MMLNRKEKETFISMSCVIGTKAETRITRSCRKFKVIFITISIPVNGKF